MLPRLLVGILLALTPALSAILVTNHLLSPPWRNFYLYNADSLTLALMLRSISNNEPFQWVFSSQIFFFPELPIFVLSRAFVTNYVKSFVSNSIFTIYILNILLYWIAFTATRDSKKAWSFTCVSLIILTLYVLLESIPDINNTTIATYLFLNTYYYGVIISGLANLALGLMYLHQINQSHGSTNLSQHRILLAILIITSLTYFSNPLLLPQVIAPLIFSIYVLKVIGCLHYKPWLNLSLAYTFGCILGQIARYLFSDYIGRSVYQYLNISTIISSPKLLWAIFTNAHQIPYATFKFTIIWMFILASAIAAIHALHMIRSKTVNLPATIMLIALFPASACGFTLFGLILSGNSYSRYLLPLPVFPLLTLVYIFHTTTFNKHYVRALSAIMVFYSIYTTHIAINSTPTNISDTENHLPDIKCYNHIMENNPFHTVGGFWTTRPIDLYTTTSSRSLQVNNKLEPFLWLSNAAPYTKLTFNGVLVNHSINGAKAPNHIYPEDLLPLGPYTKKYDCINLSIYYYQDHSPGYNALNKIIHNN